MGEEEDVRAILLFFLVFLTGCGIPLGTRDLNRYLYKDSDELARRTKNLRSGLTEKETFAILNIKLETPNLGAITIQDIQTLLYGRSEIRGTPQEVENFRKRLTSYKGYTLPYVYLIRRGSLGFFNWTISQEGFDQKVILIFDNGKLTQSVLEGRRNVHERNTSYLWEILWQTVNGASEDSARAAAKSMTGSVFPP